MFIRVIRGRLSGPTMPTDRRTLGFLACALASSFWGCGFFFGKIALTEMPVARDSAARLVSRCRRSAS